MTYRQARIKFLVESAIIYPFILIGKLIGILFPLRHTSRHFLFFPSDAIGGATKVNADIAHLLADFHPTIIFSKKYNNRGFSALFDIPGAHIIDLRNKIDNKLIYFVNVIYRGILSTWISRSGAEVVFGGESIFFYKIIPYLNKSIKVIELCHLNSWLNYSQAFVKYIDCRIFSTLHLERTVKAQYAANKVPQKYLRQLSFIDNWVDIPKQKFDSHEGLNILFVGRGAPQKRVHIISGIAETLIGQHDDIHFTFVGDVTHLLSKKAAEASTIYEYVADKEVLHAIYDRSDILILTSAYEGLPIVVMDMMVRGKVVLSTAVDSIPDYLEHKRTGLLIYELEDEVAILNEAVSLILEMNDNKDEMRAIGQNALAFSQNIFSRDLFEQKYRKIFGI